MHVPTVPNLRGRLVQTYELHCLICRPQFLLRHVCSSTRSYTDCPSLVEATAESDSVAGLHGQKTCSQPGSPLVTVTLENRLSKAVTRAKAPL